jgi:deoxyribonuclease-4
MKIGFHVPTVGGVPQAVPEAVARHCTTVQIFTSAPVQWAFRALPEEGIAAFREGMAAAGISPVFVHGRYLLNLASRDRPLWTRSVACLAEDLRRAELLGAEGVVIHLGSPGREPLRADRERVARGVDRALEQAGPGAAVLLENAAGQGHGIGREFGELSAILEASRHPERLAVCWDTAHAFAAGYELRTAEGWETTLAALQDAVGLARVRLIHCNDSRTDLGSRVDRHWHIGRGKIGREGFRLIINHPLLRDKPFIMETPESSVEVDRRNMRAFKRMVMGRG